ncbi:hypothetical protein SDC9_107377 [bioreactor metagenome]|uniref:Uncharacterized protein n=1 Tax=bioreactor metagenome TaxID=1076179 RepID=A0A645B647_9ZZZZ
MDLREQIAGVLVVVVRQHQGRQRRHALAQVGARRLAGAVRGDVDQIVTELEDDAQFLTEAGERGDLLVGQPGDHAAEHRRRGDQRAGLVGDHVEVRPDGVLALGGADRLGDLTLHQPGEGPRLEPDEVHAEIGDDVRGPGEQVVADQDGDAVVPHTVGAGRAAADLRLVHHVVVIEARHVGELHHQGRPGQVLRRPRRAEGRRQDHQQRPEPLAPGGDDVPSGFGDERHRAGRSGRESGLDLLEPLPHVRFERVPVLRG